MNMKNQLIAYVALELGLSGVADEKIKAALKKQFSIEARDIKNDDNGFGFDFDDETGGTAKIVFIPQGKHVAIKIYADFAWDAIALYQMVSTCLEE
jgi:hypothetical protein